MGAALNLTVSFHIRYLPVCQACDGFAFFPESGRKSLHRHPAVDYAKRLILWGFSPRSKKVELVRRALLVILFGAWLLPTSVAQADFAPAHRDDAPPAVQPMQQDGPQGSILPAEARQPWRSMPATVPVTAAEDRQIAVELPGLPGSASLLLSALLSAGAWQLGRSAKDIHLADLPDWYHTGGPVQVGHATPFDFHAMSAIVFGVGPEIDDPLPVRRTRAFARIDIPSDEHDVAPAAPRAPPSF